MNIRQELPADYDAVYRVVQEAFAGAGHSDGTEQDLVAALRQSGAFVPELSLVAEEDGQILGHILFTRAQVGSRTVLALAPLSVLPAHQRQGTGLALMERGHGLAARLGYDYAVVLGHPAYYPKAGYLPAEDFGIRAPFPTEEGSFLVRPLRADAPPPCGVITYDPAFGI